jgi:hypothetical protein
LKRLTTLVSTVKFDDVCHFLGTGLCLLISKGAPILAIIALIYQIRKLRAQAKLAERALKEPCNTK